jgi:hypothetical protein
MPESTAPRLREHHHLGDPDATIIGAVMETPASAFHEAIYRER